MTPKRKELSCFQRGQIIGAWKMGTTLRKIAQMLDYSHSTVQKVIKAYKDYGYAKPPPRKGRPKVLTERNKRALLRVVKKDRKAILTGKILYTITTSHTVNSLLTFILTLILYKEIKNNLTDSTSKVVSEKTIQRELHESGYFGRVGARKPYVDERNRKKRLNWAKERKSWKSEWEKVIWSDESYFRLFNGDGRRWVWRQLSDHHTRESVRVTTLGFSRLPAELLDSFLLSLNRYPISDLNKIYQYSRIFYPTICIRLLWILFNLRVKQRL